MVFVSSLDLYKKYQRLLLAGFSLCGLPVRGLPAVSWFLRSWSSWRGASAATA